MKQVKKSACPIDTVSYTHLDVYKRQLQVFATPAMIALMEKTCLNSVAPFLEEGCGTVGTLLNCLLYTSRCV